MPEEVRYEDLPVIFSTDKTVPIEIDEASWFSIWLLHNIKRGVENAIRPSDIT